MFVSSNDKNKLFKLYDSIGMRERAKKANSAIIKINLARPPEKNHPRTSPQLIKSVITYLSNHNVKCVIAESADGYLEENIRMIGLSDFVKKYQVSLIDLDFEDVKNIKVNDEIHYIPKCLKNFDIRIAIPATSKRQDAVYSNNIKLFVGAVPRKFYQLSESVRWRPKVHIDLHKSVANIFGGIMKYVPFDFYINGGLAINEYYGEFELPEVMVGNDALELDEYILKKYFKIEMPEYIKNYNDSIR